MAATDPTKNSTVPLEPAVILAVPWKEFSYVRDTKSLTTSHCSVTTSAANTVPTRMIMGLTLALSGQLTRAQTRGRRKMAGAPDARRCEVSHRPLERVVRPHELTHEVLRVTWRRSDALP